MKKTVIIILLICVLFVMGARGRYGPFIWQTVAGGIQYTKGNVNITAGTLTASGALSVDSINGEQITDNTIDDDSIDWSDCTLADFDYESNWKVFYSNGDGDVTTLALGSNNTFLESNGTGSAPAFRAVAAADLSDTATVGNILVGDGTDFASKAVVCYENAIVCYENEIVTY